MRLIWSRDQYAHNSRQVLPASLLKRSQWLGSWNDRDVFVYAGSDGEQGRLIWSIPGTNSKPQCLSLGTNSSSSITSDGRLLVRADSQTLQFKSSDEKLLIEFLAALQTAAYPSRSDASAGDCHEAWGGHGGTHIPSNEPPVPYTAGRAPFIGWACPSAPQPWEELFVSWAQPSWASTPTTATSVPTALGLTSPQQTVRLGTIAGTASKWERK
jgi:hypothetical protein